MPIHGHPGSFQHALVGAPEKGGAISQLVAWAALGLIEPEADDRYSGADMCRVAGSLG